MAIYDDIVVAIFDEESRRGRDNVRRIYISREALRELRADRRFSDCRRYTATVRPETFHGLPLYVVPDDGSVPFVVV